MTVISGNIYAASPNFSVSASRATANFFGRWVATPITGFIETVKNHPKISLSILAITAVAATALRTNWNDVRRWTYHVDTYESSQEALDHLFAKCEYFMDPFKKQPIEEAVSHFIRNQMGDFSQFANNEKNHQYLLEKLKTILVDCRPSIDKKKIFANALSNFKTFITETVQRIQRDLTEDEAFRRIFRVGSNAQITNIEILGEETHNCGKTPLLVVVKFNNNTRIVYKPRSMIVEQILCGQEGSVFQAFKLPTYRIYDKAGREYGYCEFLENNQSENTFNSKAEIEEYIRRFVLMDQICSELRITDLHYENIATSCKLPYIIDAEAITPMRSSVHTTGLLAELMPGYSFDNGTKNRIWVRPSVLQECSARTANILQNGAAGVERDPTSSVDALMELGVLDVIQEPRNLFTSEQWAIINQAKNILDEHRHRIVLITTFDLRSMIMSDINKGFAIFKEILDHRLAAFGFCLSYSREELKEKFAYDVGNNDIPIFYFHPSEGRVYYHNICLGKLLTYATNTSMSSSAAIDREKSLNQRNL